MAQRPPVPPFTADTAAQKVPPDVDEIALAGGLIGEAIPLVKCKTVDLEVPATAEIVFEGHLSTEYLEEEGPFGESMGYVDLRTLSQFMELTCVTHRRDPIWVSIISQVTPSESSKIKGMSMPTLIERTNASRSSVSFQASEYHFVVKLCSGNTGMVPELNEKISRIADGR